MYSRRRLDSLIPCCLTGPPERHTWGTPPLLSFFLFAAALQLLHDYHIRHASSLQQVVGGGGGGRGRGQPRATSTAITGPDAATGPWPALHAGSPGPTDRAGGDLHKVREK